MEIFWTPGRFEVWTCGPLELDILLRKIQPEMLENIYEKANYLQVFSLLMSPIISSIGEWVAELLKRCLILYASLVTTI